MTYQFLTPEESTRLAIKRHIERLPDWMIDKWCGQYTHRIDSYKGELFSKEADRQFEHQPYRQGDQ